MFENLFDNLLVVFVLFSLFIMIYCKIKDQTLFEVLNEIKEFIVPQEIPMEEIR
jgi:hypothetical protein|tara:strand:+ start:672 stop:833 length:162 start_codon:yes stop_codon:yes gene_type:complete